MLLKDPLEFAKEFVELVNQAIKSEHLGSKTRKTMLGAVAE